MGNGYGKSKVTVSKRYSGGNTIVTNKRKPLLDSKVYTVMFDEISLCEYATHLIPENNYA